MPIVEDFTSVVVAAGFGVDPRSTVLLIVDAPIGFALDALETTDRRGKRVVVTTTSCCPEYIEDLWDLQPNALLAGAAIGERMPEVMDYITRGQPYRLAQCLRSGLSQFERSVLRYVAQGKSNKEIARQLGCAEHTIANALTRVYNVLGVGSRVEAANYYWDRWQLKRWNPSTLTA
jgi:DNA-binding CsgD family transcriptional regulator